MRKYFSICMYCYLFRLERQKMRLLGSPVGNSVLGNNRSYSAPQSPSRSGAITYKIRNELDKTISRHLEAGKSTTPSLRVPCACLGGIVCTMKLKETNYHICLKNVGRGKPADISLWTSMIGKIFEGQKY